MVDVKLGPGAVIGIGTLAAIGIFLFIFRDKISQFFSDITGGAATTRILGENLLSNLEGTQNLLNSITEFFTNPPNPFEGFEFPEFPEFPDFQSFFDDFFSQFGGGNGEDPPFTDEPTEEEEELPGGPGIGPVTFPPGCFINSAGILECPSPPTFDACAENPGLPQCQPEEPEGPSIIGGGPTDPICIEVPMLTGGTFNTCTGVITPPSGDPGFIGPPAPEIEPPFMPPVELPPGFEGGGPSFEGGTIFETTDESCQTLSCVIDRNPGFTASQAADRLAEIQGTFGDFDFGSNTGSGFGPGDDPTGPIVTGGATLESEEKKAACITCELFGLNCPICSGTI